MYLSNPLSTWLADSRYRKLRKYVVCLPGDSVGDFVCIRGSIINSKWQVEKADPGNSLKMPAIGVLINKTSSTEGEIQLIDEIHGIFTGLAIGKIYYVGYTSPSVVIPTIGINGYSWIQHIGYAIDSNVLFLTGNVFQTLHR